MRTYHRYGSYFELVTYWREMFFFLSALRLLSVSDWGVCWLAGWLVSMVTDGYDENTYN